MNAKLQRITREDFFFKGGRDLREKCKEIEENNRMGKIRNLFKM